MLIVVQQAPPTYETKASLTCQGETETHAPQHHKVGSHHTGVPPQTQGPSLILNLGAFYQALEKY